MFGIKTLRGAVDADVRQLNRRCNQLEAQIKALESRIRALEEATKPKGGRVK